MRQPRANIKSGNAPRNQARRKAIFEGRLLEEGSNFFRGRAARTASMIFLMLSKAMTTCGPKAS